MERLRKPYDCPKVLWDFFDRDARKQVIAFIRKTKVPRRAYRQDFERTSPFYFILSESRMGTTVRISCGEETQPIFLNTEEVKKNGEHSYW